MLTKTVNVLAAIGVFSLMAELPAAAQPPVGQRASGMAGAFVAVADDPTGVYWNPAGLATGTLAGAVLDFGEAKALPEDVSDPAGANRRTVRMLALAAPPLGLTYYRLGAYVAGPLGTAVPPVQGREEGRRSVRALTTDQFGVTLLQSITQYVVVGATLKWVRGEAAAGVTDAVTADNALEAAADLDGVSKSSGDIDVGAMLAVEHIRVGVVARNLTTPEFAVDEAGSEPLELTREVRIGAAWGLGWPGISPLVVSVDADATRRVTPSGDRRDVAMGIETWWLGHRIGVRGGVRGSTVGDARPVVAGGVSAGITRSIFVDAHLGRGEGGEQTWGLGGRFTF